MEDRSKDRVQPGDRFQWTDLDEAYGVWRAVRLVPETMGYWDMERESDGKKSIWAPLLHPFVRLHSRFVPDVPEAPGEVAEPPARSAEPPAAPARSAEPQAPTLPVHDFSDHYLALKLDGRVLKFCASCGVEVGGQARPSLPT